MKVIVTTRTRSETTKGRCVLGTRKDLEDVQQLLIKEAGACLVNCRNLNHPHRSLHLLLHSFFREGDKELDDYHVGFLPSKHSYRSV